MTAEEMRLSALSADDLPREPVDVPWATNGSKWYVRSLEFADYKPWLMGGEIKVTVESVAKMLVKAIVTENGEQIFRAEDWRALTQKSPGLIMDLFNRMMTLSNLTAESQEEAAEAFGEAQDGEASTG